MERYRGDHHHRLHHTDPHGNRSEHFEQHYNFFEHHQHHHPSNHQDQYYTDQSHDHQFNNYNHGHQSNYEFNRQPSAEITEPFGGGGFRSNDRKRGRHLSARGDSPDHNDGGATVKLYVAPVPRTMTEEDICHLFEGHGSVVEVVIPRDKWSSQQQGYCFVKYATLDEADRAIRALHNRYIIPGEVAPIRVKYADGEREHLGVFVAKLYVGSVNKQASKQEIEEIFSPYGHVEDVYIVRDELKQSRGCAFVKFSHRDMALAAIKSLNGIFTMRGCDQPLIVRYADPKKPKTGELRGNYAFGGPNFGPCSLESIRQPPNFGGSMGGCILPNAPYNMQQISTNSQPQLISHTTKQELATSHITEQSLAAVKHSPSQLSQMPLQRTQTPPTCLQSTQQAIYGMEKQTQNLEQQECTQIPVQESPWNGSNSQVASVTSAAPEVPSSPPREDPEDCEWSEHACPDGFKYYYNCITCESRVSYLTSLTTLLPAVWIFVLCKVILWLLFIRLVPWGGVGVVEVYSSTKAKHDPVFIQPSFLKFPSLL